MNSQAHSFITNVLGLDGAQALLKAAERAPVLESVLVPRTIVAWLSSSIRLGYEGEIPGLENSYISIEKSEESELFDGAITVGELVHPFDQATLLHIAASIGVALQIDGQKLDPSLRGQDLSKLGKSIDLLVRAKLIAKSLAAGEIVEKAISAIKPGAPLMPSAKNNAPGKHFDYTHVLSPEHRAIGYTLHVTHSPGDTVQANLFHPASTKPVGHVTAEHNPGDKSINIDVTDLNPQHRGKGLGSSMYEAVMAHAKHSLGAQHVVGSVHSSMAAKVHERLSAKHGMNYRPMETPFPHLASPTPGPFDNRHGPYSYDLKSEKASLRREVRLTKSESNRKCTECGGTQFKNDKFVGCICFRSLAKSTKTTESTDGTYTVKFNGADWDEDSITALVSILKG